MYAVYVVCYTVIEISLILQAIILLFGHMNISNYIKLHIFCKLQYNDLLNCWWTKSILTLHFFVSRHWDILHNREKRWLQHPFHADFKTWCIKYLDKVKKHIIIFTRDPAAHFFLCIWHTFLVNFSEIICHSFSPSASLCPKGLKLIVVGFWL